MLAFGVALSMMIFSSVHKVALVVVAIFFAVAVLLALWPITCGRGRRAIRQHVLSPCLMDGFLRVRCRVDVISPNL
jgi:hypothetical protein